MRSFLTFLVSFLYIGFTYAQPNPDFSASPLEVCVGEQIQFTDLSTSSNTITAWTWDFGDGSTSTVQNPTHAYTNSGNFTIILTAVDANGAAPEVKINYITINPLPNTGFDTNILGGCTLPNDVSFTNVQPSSGVTYNWDFGNGTNSTSGNPPNVTYTNQGTYDITLSNTNTVTGCQNSVTQTIDIYDYQADFNITSGNACEGNQVVFSDNSSPGTDSWNWSFGDGTISTVPNPSHTYTSTGTFTITLTVSNSVNGCSDTYTETITVFPTPNPSFTFNPSSGCAPLPVTFTNTSSGSGTFDWNFGDGTQITNTNPPPHSYTNNGVYSVTLTQTDANGCSGSTAQYNIISVSSITAEFEANIREGCEDLDVDFTDLSTSPNTNDPITGWNWDFGNGSTFNGQNPPTQTYSEGVYDVELTVTTNAGCSQTFTLTEYIKVGIPPNANFTWTPSSGCAKSPFNFTNTSTVSIPSNPNDFTYLWSFGDGGTSDFVDPVYDYPLDTGFFDVQLITSFRGCPDTISYTDAVYIIAPIANFSVTEVYCSPTLPLVVTFNDLAIIGEVTDNSKMIWDWGDGTNEEYFSPNVYANNPGQITHTFDNLGSYNVKQVVHNYTTGCSDSITTIIHLSELEGVITASNDSVCNNDYVTFSNNNIVSTHGVFSSNFNINNDTIIFLNNFTYPFDNPGTSEIILTVVNNVGCTDTVEFLLDVLALPTASINPSENVGCSPLTVTFTNNSVSQSGVPISNFDWTFENGTTQTTTGVNQTTNYTFINEGIFETQLNIIDDFGCVSPTASVQTEITKPIADFDFPPVVCNDETFTANNTSVDFTSSEWLINNVQESTSESLTTSFNHFGSPTELSFVDSITLIVTDINGCKDTLKQEIITSTPNANFEFEFSGANINENGNFICPPVFTDLTDSSESYGNITDWNWDFSDGKFSTLQNPNNTYVFAGTYSGTLVITDEFGCTDSITYVDYLTIGGPVGEVEWTLFDKCANEYKFSPYNLEGVSDIVWDLGNGEIINSLDEFNYIYETAGTFYPTATLINEDDCNILYILDTIEVKVSPITPYFEINPLTMNWGEQATITDYSTGGFGGIVDWYWDTGGEQFHNNGTPFDYLFNSAGELVVTLIVTDSEGCQASYEVIVNVTTNLTIPNILTPNGDNANDVFRLIDNPFKNYTVTILNRWGNIVNESIVIEDDFLWDGTKRNGDYCVDGVYFYIINGIQRDGSERTEHGFVHLER
ncbi:PKD domain-containing protein [Brumimicrobium mesophilum]|uniref:PKD domain-containing protein n=1 Tax=Brumimicrobium mesophilum TaxID=392717 RepID=UPI000D14132B|nr:PKD domain-containing protein [Brumimicrobium mesophilum]